MNTKHSKIGFISTTTDNFKAMRLLAEAMFKTNPILDTIHVCGSENHLKIYRSEIKRKTFNYGNEKNS